MNGAGWSEPGSRAREDCTGGREKRAGIKSQRSGNRKEKSLQELKYFVILRYIFLKKKCEEERWAKKEKEETGMTQVFFNRFGRHSSFMLEISCLFSFADNFCVSSQISVSRGYLYPRWISMQSDGNGTFNGQVLQRFFVKKKGPFKAAFDVIMAN